METPHIKHGVTKDENGKPHSWWTIDFRSPKSLIAFLLTIALFLGAAWAGLSVMTISVLDPHIRNIIREELPAALSQYIDAALERAAKPHIAEASATHKHLEERIDSTDQAVKYNREEREKFQIALLQRDEEQKNEIAALREEVRQLDATIKNLYEYLLKQEARKSNGKGT